MSREGKILVLVGVGAVIVTVALMSTPIGWWALLLAPVLVLIGIWVGETVV